VGLFDDIITRLLRQLEPIFRPFQKLFDLVFKFWSNITGLFGKIRHLIDSVVAEVDAWRNFKEEPSFKNRLISLPVAYDQTKELILSIPQAWHAVLDLFAELRGKLETTGNPTEEAESALKDIEEGGFRNLLQKFPRFAKGFEKVLGFVAIIADALESIIKGVDDLQAIVDTLRGIREEVETQNTIFLQQKNPRRTVKLKDGGSIKIRVGHLHS